MKRVSCMSLLGLLLLLSIASTNVALAASGERAPVVVQASFFWTDPVYVLRDWILNHLIQWHDEHGGNPVGTGTWSWHED